MIILVVTWTVISLMGLAYTGVKLRMREVPVGPAQDEAQPSPAPPDPRILARMELYTTLARRPPPPARFPRRGIVVEDEAVEWVHTACAEGVERGRCPVCADPLGTQPICACRSCESAHHLECWQYAGGCARYACGSDVARVN